MASDNNELVYWYWLRGTSGIGPSRIHSLIETLGSPKALFAMSYDDYRSVPWVGNKLAHSLEDSKTRLSEFLIQIDKDLSAAELLNAQILTLSDPGYPSRLKEQRNISPPLLYVRGNVNSLEYGKSIGVIGTREPSTRGMTTAREISMDLARGGWTIISGLARGIDTAGHKGALEGEGRTIAVLGCGLDVNYPSENVNLAAQIARDGAVVTQYPFGTRPDPDNLKRRNNVTVALADCIFAAEYPVGSGTEIGVNKALDLGKPIFTLDRDSRDGKSGSGSDKVITTKLAYPIRSHDGKEVIMNQVERFYSTKLVILFDLDGVLVDTRKLEKESLKSTINKFNGTEPSDQELSSVVGLSPGKALNKLIGSSSQNLISSYKGEWSRLSKKLIRPQSKFIKILKSLNETNHVLGIVTSRNRQQTDLLLIGGRIEDYFSSVTTWGDTSKHKPDPAPFGHALENYDEYDGAVYIGDRSDDYYAAQEAGIDFIGVGWFSNTDELDKLKGLGAETVLKRQVDLEPAIDRLVRKIWLRAS